MWWTYDNTGPISQGQNDAFNFMISSAPGEDNSGHDTEDKYTSVGIMQGVQVVTQQ